MDEFKKDIRDIRESQIRMEGDLKYHIRRTDALEARVDHHNEVLQPLYAWTWFCLLYTSPSPRDLSTSRMPSSA